MLNFAFERGGVVERVEQAGAAFVVKQYPVFGPKALAGVESLADTIRDRCFAIWLQRSTKRLPRLRLNTLHRHT